MDQNLTQISEAGAFGDFVQTFQFENLNIRGRMVRLHQAFADAVTAGGASSAALPDELF